MDNTIQFYRNKWPSAVHIILKDEDLDTRMQMFTFTCICGDLDYDTCFTRLTKAENWTTHVILAEPNNSEMFRAIEDFIKYENYMSYKIDGIVRIILTPV